MLALNLVSTTAPARPDAIAALRRAAAEAAREAGLRNGDVQDIRLAVGEAATNVVLHAYPPGTDGAIALEADAVDGEVVFTVRDDGRGLAPRTDSPGAGLGLGLILRLARRVDIETPPDGGTVIRMWFGPHPAPTGTAAPGA